MGNTKKTVTAGIIGTAVGVAAGAATMYLSDKKNREKALKKAKEMKKLANETAHDLQKKAVDLREKVEGVKDEILGKEEKSEEDK